MKKEIEGEFEKEFKKDIIAAMKDVRREIKESYVSIAYMKEAIIFLTYNNEVIVLSNNKMRNNLIKSSVLVHCCLFIDDRHIINKMFDSQGENFHNLFCCLKM